MMLLPKKGLDILALGAGQQSSAVALMSCENVKKGMETHPEIPVYDAVLFCDLGAESVWVYQQVDFIRKECEACGIPFYVIPSPLYQDFLTQFGVNWNLSSIPFWSIGEDGSKSKMRRHCTIDYKILMMQQFVRYQLLGYSYREHLRKEDTGAHTMHIGFSAEERQRIFESKNPMFKNRFPLTEMGLTRRDNYRYLLEEWGLDTKASACIFCPFHRNYYFQYLRERYPDSFQQAVQLDDLLEEKQPLTPIKSKLYISRSRVRLRDLTPTQCHDGQFFPYRDRMIWTGH